ncbi:MAG: hypothetical protein DBW81_00745 [Synechococcus sp. MED-G67]|nr:MAG: hypothetical protein DBW81_00745 [Synechococcus sp. MED-G67]CAK28932.1 Conserved hypothetical protein [Synechococcus sp. RCC307]HCA61613.1 hypothetical protein [Synechococcales bacterium UBA8647]|tara:strand:- start:2500 stop:3135 length:636 start_codon:yes stop_codon:yes gene_type:complete
MALIGWPTLLIHPQCPLCHQAWSGPSFCPSCRDQLKLNQPRPQGTQPIPWRALGLYDANWRQLILRLRQRASPKVIRVLASECLALLPKPRSAIQLCAIPPRPGHQPGPPQWIQREISRQSRMRAQPLLHRRRACLGQHHLSGSQRRQNLQGVFSVEPLQHPSAKVMLLDDVVTTGATSQAAAEALQAAGYGVVGVLCLAHTSSLFDATMT